MSIEYKIMWEVALDDSTGVFTGKGTFYDATDWITWDEDGACVEGVVDALHEDAGVLPAVLAEALKASGFRWSVEVRERAIPTRVVEVREGSPYDAGT